MGLPVGSSGLCILQSFIHSLGFTRGPRAGLERRFKPRSDSRKRSINPDGCRHLTSQTSRFPREAVNFYLISRDFLVQFKYFREKTEVSRFAKLVQSSYLNNVNQPRIREIKA
jgi:hypothetical protein